jgi:hypothetical protein
MQRHTNRKLYNVLFLDHLALARVDRDKPLNESELAPDTAMLQVCERSALE